MSTPKNIPSVLLKKRTVVIVGGIFLVAGIISTTLSTHTYVAKSADTPKVQVKDTVATNATPTPVPLDTVAYDKKLMEIANIPAPKPVAVAPATTTSGTATPLAAPKATTPVKPAPVPLWPVKTVYPNSGALLPFNRIVAYYGNFYSTKMGVLGQYSEDVVLQKLAAEVKNWQLADPNTPVIPAVDYIAITAQGSPSIGGKYRLRMPEAQIDHAVELAKKINGIVFLDIQVGQSTVQTEIPLLEKYLKMPEVHLALDPEFSMKHSEKPGSIIGTMDAADVNFAATYLAKLVQDNKLPPKVLVIHRFTQGMVTHYKDIKPLPEVEFVMDMDGWGFGAKKINTYKSVIYPEPVQFTGFKLFYKNDLLPPSTKMLTPTEILKLSPQPLYIQYQ